MMLETVCAHIHNYFCPDENIVRGTWTIEGGSIDLSDLSILPGQYFRIVGSALNDGVYRYPVEPPEKGEPELQDETFTGEIWPMRVPRAVLQTVTDIEAWQTKYGATMASPLQSENVIGVYSYTKAAGGSEGASSADAWKDAFKSRLNPWRKLR